MRDSRSRSVLALLTPVVIILFACGDASPGKEVLEGTGPAAEEPLRESEPGRAAMPSTIPPLEDPGDPFLQAEPEDLRRFLREGEVQVRIEVAARLSEASDIPVEERVGILLEALVSEVARPTVDPPPVSTFLSPSDWMRFHFTREMGSQGPDAEAALLREAEGSGEVAERAALALGYAGLPSAIPFLRTLLTEAEHPDVRTDAAYLLGELGAEEAIPDLEAARQDPFEMEVQEKGRLHSFFPVREQAEGALAKIRENGGLP